MTTLKTNNNNKPALFFVTSDFDQIFDLETNIENSKNEQKI